MNEELKANYLQTIFQFKNLLNGKLTDKSWTLSLNELLILESIQQGANLTEIREKLAVTKAAISQSLSSLEKKGYILRETDTANRRQVIVRLTSEGLSALTETAVKFDENFQAFVGEFGADRLAQLLELMERMMELLKG